MSDLAVRFDRVGKMYKVFPTRRDNLFDAIGIPPLLSRGRRTTRYGQFWALRDVSFELPKGERLGIIGRNGAGKSTLLKLITGNVPPTEGTVEVDGAVQALLEIGGGLHPEFTGRENIEASLGFLGLGRGEIAEAVADIADFTELGRFLDQPFKTYSQGMQARLSIGIATTVEPEVLIIDEILGAGDAYFFAKSTARMQRLIGGGASVLIVSHALDQIARFCDETMWVDRGRIVMRGATPEVVKAYERFIRELDDRRLRARNRKSQAGADAFARDTYTDELEVRLTPHAASACDVAELALSRDGSVEERLAVGAPQDADPTAGAFVVAHEETWGDPATDGTAAWRTAGAGAATIFPLWFFYPESSYRVSLRYRSSAAVRCELARGGEVVTIAELPPRETWTTVDVELARDDDESAVAMSRWAGAEGLRIASVRLCDEDGAERAVFQVGRPMSIDVEVTAPGAGTYPLIPAALVFATNGVVVTRHIGEETMLALDGGETVRARLDFGPLLLGNGTYLVSVGLYRELDPELVEPSHFYDYFDKSFEFRVAGNPPLHTELVRHPGRWTLERDGDVRQGDGVASRSPSTVG